MAEFVQRRKEEMLAEAPVLVSHFTKPTVKNILKQREKFEYRLMRRNKQKSDFTQYIKFLKSVMKKVDKMDVQNRESVKLMNQHKKRIILIYEAALQSFKDDVSLWKEYIHFLIKSDRLRELQSVIDRALLLHGHISDELYVFAVRQEFVNVKNIQKAREMYTVGLRAHKNSSALHLEAFKSELAFSAILIEKELRKAKDYNKNDPALNGSIAKVIFETAVENVKNDTNVFFQMYQAARAHDFATELADEIQNYMSNTFCTDPNFWNTLARNELSDKSHLTEKIRIKNCLEKYDEALTIINTDEMWDKYLDTILKISSDNDKTEVYKRNLLRQSMYNAHLKNKLKPKHYIDWINKSQSSMCNEILDWALETYPNDPDILEMKINKLVVTDKLSAYKLFKQHMSIISPNIWVFMVQCFSNEPQAKEIFDTVFADNSICVNEVKQQLGNEYLLWLNKHESLNAARNAYNKMILNSSCNPSLCKTLVTIEIEQEKIDVTKIRQHFTLACMQFGKTNIDLWMDRIHFEVKFGSPKIVSSTYHQALTTLNNEESDKFVEQYALNASKFNNL